MHPNLTTPEQINTLLQQFGRTDTADILISLKPAPPKKPKRGTAVVPFRRIGDAFAAICASGREDLGLKDIEVSWAEGKEPALIEWLKKMGKLGSNGQSKPTDPDTSSAQPTLHDQDHKDGSSSSTPFSSFPSTFVSNLCFIAIVPDTNDQI